MPKPSNYFIKKNGGKSGKTRLSNPFNYSVTYVSQKGI